MLKHFHQCLNKRDIYIQLFEHIEELLELGILYILFQPG